MCAPDPGPQQVAGRPPYDVGGTLSIRLRDLERLVDASLGQTAPMTEKRRSRVSIGLYAEGRMLWPTVVRLLDCGFLLDQLGIAALPVTLARLDGPTILSHSDWSRVEGLLKDVVTMEGPAGLAIAASRSVHLPFAVGSGDLGAGAGNRRLVRLWSELEAPLAKGATALAVIAPSNEQQWRGTRILLEQSAYPVQTHEIRPAGGYDTDR